MRNIPHRSAHVQPLNCDCLLKGFGSLLVIHAIKNLNCTSFTCFDGGFYLTEDEISLV
jgi:hypothetical protein